MPTIRKLAEGSSTQRGGLNHQAIEDYLKTIYKLSQENAPVSTSRVAEARDVKPASATGMLKRLANLELVHYEKRRGVTLTEEGRQIALEVLRHHRLIEAYLIQALGYTWDEVHEEADVLEHVISERLEERIAAALGHPGFDPHGAPIPNKAGELPEVVHQPLNRHAAGERVTISRISAETDTELLRYLAERQLRPGINLSIDHIEPSDGAITVTVAGQQHTLSDKTAATILVASPSLVTE